MLKDQPPCGIAKDTWIRRPELCQYLQFSPITLRRLRKRGLPSIGSDRLRRYHLPSVIQWLADRSKGH